MKIDNYIRHLELKRKGLSEKRTSLQKAADKIAIKKGYDPYYEDLTRLKNEISNINNKLIFLLKLRKEIIEHEANRVQEVIKGK